MVTNSREVLYCFSILYAVFGAKSSQPQQKSKVNKTLVNIEEISDCKR